MSCCCILLYFVVVFILEPTLVYWFSFFRQVCLFMQEPLGGNGRVIEIDEPLFGKWKYGKGEQDHEGVWVVGGFERATGRFFLHAVEKRDTATLAPILAKNISPGSIVFPDMWKAYKNLWWGFFIHLKNGNSCLYFYLNSSREYCQSAHFSVNQSLEFGVMEAGTNKFEGCWTLSKMHCPSFKGIVLS